MEIVKVLASNGREMYFHVVDGKKKRISKEVALSSEKAKSKAKPKNIAKSKAKGKAKAKKIVTGKPKGKSKTKQKRVSEISPKKLSFPDWQKASEEMNDFIYQNAYDSQGHKLSSFPKKLYQLWNYPPWDSFSINFAKILKDNTDFNEMVANERRDSKTKTLDEIKRETALANLGYFSHELMEYLKKHYDYSFTQITEPELIKLSKKGKLTLSDYSINPTKHFVLN